MSDNIVQKTIVADDTNTLNSDISVESSQNNIIKTITSSNNGENIIEVAILPVNPRTQEHQQYLLYVPVATAGSHIGVAAYNDSDFIVNNGYVKLALSREAILNEIDRLDNKIDTNIITITQLSNETKALADKAVKDANDALTKATSVLDRINVVEQNSTEALNKATNALSIAANASNLATEANTNAAIAIKVANDSMMSIKTLETNIKNKIRTVDTVPNDMCIGDYIFLNEGEI